MGPLALILNGIWLIFGGFWMAVGWLIAGCLMIVSVIGIPFAPAAFGMARYAFLPFGQTAVDREWLTGRIDLSTSPAGTMANIVWLVLAGWWLALGHLIAAFGLAITIIGLPFAWAHLKLAGYAIWPVGQQVVLTDELNYRRRPF
jgi:uncharacterized membrane protein YccF (DUF307 family)